MATDILNAKDSHVVLLQKLIIGYVSSVVYIYIGEENALLNCSPYP